MIFVLSSTELRLFGIFPLEGWQAQFFEMVLRKDLRRFSHAAVLPIRLM